MGLIIVCCWLHHTPSHTLTGRQHGGSTPVHQPRGAPGAGQHWPLPGHAQQGSGQILVLSIPFRGQGAMHCHQACKGAPSPWGCEPSLHCLGRGWPRAGRAWQRGLALLLGLGHHGSHATCSPFACVQVEGSTQLQRPFKTPPWKCEVPQLKGLQACVQLLATLLPQAFTHGPSRDPSSPRRQGPPLPYPRNGEAQAKCHGHRVCALDTSV